MGSAHGTICLEAPTPLIVALIGLLCRPTGELDIALLAVARARLFGGRRSRERVSDIRNLDAEFGEELGATRVADEKPGAAFILDGFLVSHPRISVEVVIDDSPVDVVEAGCDAGIR